MAICTSAKSTASASARVDAETGIVTTIAGTGVPGMGEEGVRATETEVNSVEVGVWADPDGTVFY